VRTLSILGSRVIRVEDRKFVTTGGVYTDDLVQKEFAGAAHLTFVRSPMAHGRIRNIDARAAREAPGVIAVFTPDDLAVTPLAPSFPMFNPQMRRPWLASEVVRFVGEPIAAVLTEQLYQGEDAAELIEVDLEPLPTVLTTARSASDEVLLFPAAGTNLVATFGEQRDPSMFNGCEVVLTQRLTNQRVAPVPLEPRAAAASWGPDGRLTLWCSNQGAQFIQGTIAGMLGIGTDLVHIRTADVGGGFGAKIEADLEFAILAQLAKILGRPVRWAETRSENLTGMVHGRGQDQVITVGGRRDGTVTAYSLEVEQDCGAYPRLGGLLPTMTLMMAPGVYEIENVNGYARCWVTNTTSIGAYRGAGRPEATFAIERALDLFAAEIEMDPAEVRRKNLLPPFSVPRPNGAGAVYDSGDYAAALDKVLAAGDYLKLRAEQARRRSAGLTRQLGLGVSVYVEITGLGLGEMKEAAEVEVHADGTVTVLTGTSPHGQGHATAWAMIVSDQLGIPIEKITVLHGDTDLIPAGGGTLGSRSLQQGGVAVHQASIELVELAKQRAADLLEANPDDMVVDLAEAGVRVVGSDQVIRFAELAGRERLLAHTTFVAPGPTFPFGAHLAVVEVDVETGKSVLQRIITVDDAGRVINPLLCEGQRHGGIAQGVAQALYEEVLYDDLGNPLTSTLADYPMISAAELPSFELLAMQTNTSFNPLGAKGIGEAATIGSTPAVLNAVVDAVSYLGVRHIEMPATAHRVWDAIQAAQTKHTVPNAPLGEK
jgi:carbon-monoxide dehydrogenase large subunit